MSKFTSTRAVDVSAVEQHESTAALNYKQSIFGCLRNGPTPVVPVALRHLMHPNRQL